MADDGKTGSENDQDANKTGTGEDTSNKGSEGASGDQGTGTGESGTGDVVSRAEFEQIKARMQAADQAKSKAETELSELKKKDMTALEKAETEIKERDATIATLQTRVSEMALQNAFLTNNKYTWHDPEDALRLLNRENVEVGEDGKVTGLAPAIAELAKKKPHLLKSEKDGEGDSGGSSSAASGSASNGRRKGEEKQDKKDYSRRFPALKR